MGMAAVFFGEQHVCGGQLPVDGQVRVVPSDGAFLPTNRNRRMSFSLEMTRNSSSMSLNAFIPCDGPPSSRDPHRKCKGFPPFRKCDFSDR